MAHDIVEDSHCRRFVREIGYGVVAELSWAGDVRGMNKLTDSKIEAVKATIEAVVNKRLVDFLGENLLVEVLSGRAPANEADIRAMFSTDLDRLGAFRALSDQIEGRFDGSASKAVGSGPWYLYFFGRADFPGKKIEPALPG